MTEDEIVAHMRRMLAFANEKRKGMISNANQKQSAISVPKQKVRARLGQEAPLRRKHERLAETRQQGE